MVQLALNELEGAKARAAAAAKLAAEVVSLPATPAHNTVGEQLRDVLHPYAPEGEMIVPVAIDVDGAMLVPQVERTYKDNVLWNALDGSTTPEEFAKVTCAEVGLPASFEAIIAEQIKHAVAAARAAEPPPTEGVVTLDLHVTNEAGVTLRDRMLWDTDSAEPTPEAFARQMCADLALPELEGSVAFAIRQQLDARQAPRAELPADADLVLRSEREALDWSPHVSLPGEPDPGEHYRVEAAEAERRDRLRKRAVGAAQDV